MHGPPTSFPTPYGPGVRVLDTCALSLKPKRRKVWRANRVKALQLWAASGLSFTVTEGYARDYPKYDPTSPDFPRWVWEDDENGNHIGGHMAGDEEAFMRGLVVPGYARLMFMPTNWGASDESPGTVPGMGWMFEDGGFAIISKENWVANMGNSWSGYVVRHEFGHALGLSHQRDPAGNPASVMYVSPKGYKGGELPDDHDLNSLWAYHVAP